jgi:DNA-binding transcriptional MerR regulator
VRLVKITDLTEQLGISSRSLRYYEQVGLITSIRPEFEKYRFFDAPTVERLKQILVLRKMQIPIRDILRIYESEDMSVVVEAFVDRIAAIDNEVNALSEMKRIVSDFLEIMLSNGIRKISALPLLYDRMSRQLEACGEDGRKTLTYEELSAASQRVSKAPEVRLITLPPMRVLSSYTKDSAKTLSDAGGFWQWLHARGLVPAGYGNHGLLEYQDSETRETVMLLRVDDGFINDSPYMDERFDGGLFAACGVYADEDIAACREAVIRSFDGNAFYQIDYRHNGRLRHDALLETVLSPDETRERLELYLPVKKRAPDVSLFECGVEVSGVTLGELEKENRVLQKHDIDLTALTLIMNPRFTINEDGEAEFASAITQRMLSTDIPVKIPFRVDLVFKTNNASVRLYHGKASAVVNTGNVFDLGKTQESLNLTEPVFGTESTYKHRGGVHKNDYNTLTWLVGDTHLAVMINGEIRYCGTNHPYMQLDLNKLEAYPVLIGSNSYETVTIRSVAVSKLQPRKPVRMKEGVLSMLNRQSNNVLPNLHKYMINYLGQNYGLPGCMSYLMECLGEDKDAFDYWFFSGLTGDNLTQLYCRDEMKTVFCLSSVAGKEYIGDLLDACGYEHTYVTSSEVSANKLMYISTIMAYIDRGIPVILRGSMPKDRDDALTYYLVICGYEEYGKSLLYLFDNSDEPEKSDADDLCGDLIFAGAKKKDADLKALYRRTVLDMPKLIKKNDIPNCSFGARAFLDWADDIESGRFDKVTPDDFNKWRDHDTYVCILATNASCLDFLERTRVQNPDLTFIGDVMNQFRRMAELWKELEAVGGGFNATLENLKDRANRKTIADKLREFPICYDRIEELLPK